MKKTSIYLLSLIIIIVVAFSVLQPAYKMSEAFFEGYAAGYSSSTEAEGSKAILPDLGTPVDVQFNPEMATLIEPKDSIVFDNGSRMPLVINKVAIVVPETRVPAWYSAISLISYPLQIILLGILIWRFLKFIINISREEIFEKKNVKLLRQFSVLLLCIALLEIISNASNALLFNSLSVTMKGYSLSAFINFPWGNILLGCIGLLMAQVWARGIEIKREQDLTI